MVCKYTCLRVRADRMNGMDLRAAGVALLTTALPHLTSLRSLKYVFVVR